MRFLKKKIALKSKETDDCINVKAEFGLENNVKLEFEVKKENSETTTSSNLESNMSIKEDALPLRGPRKNRTSPNADSKNIVKNYGKAICAFASCKVSVPYIETIIENRGYDGFNVKKFMDLMKQRKETTNSMESVRKLLMEEPGDTEEEIVFKKLFKELSILFMKYFAVNWIYSGKLVHKNAHLKFRFKMLRRIQRPEFFTYLKTSAKN